MSDRHVIRLRTRSFFWRYVTARRTFLIFHKELDIHPDLWLIGAVNVGLGLSMAAGAVWCKSDRK
jgi:hypothetical protein